MRTGRVIRIGAHPVRHHLLLGPRAEWNYEQRQREDGLSRGRCEGDWRRATPQRSFINEAAVPYSVAARAAPPIARRAAPPRLTSPPDAAHRPRRPPGPPAARRPPLAPRSLRVPPAPSDWACEPPDPTTTSMRILTILLLFVYRYSSFFTSS